jgi:hypothetical protein
MDKWKEIADTLVGSLLISEIEEYDETVLVIQGYKQIELRKALSLYQEARHQQMLEDHCVAIDAGHI